MNKTPTDRQQEWLKCICRLTRKHSRGPTLRELANAMGVNPNAAVSTLDLLEKKELISRPQVITKGPPEITKKGREWV